MVTHPGVPGEPTHTGTAFVETAASTIQSFAPINSIHQHQCAAHLYADDMTRQLVVHHFCAHQNDEMRQCLLYDSEEANARLIGVEYMISERLFLPLPDEEKRLWHSHEYEVKSGLLFMPGVPGPIERKDMEKVVKTYGKVFHFWQVDKGDALPVGPANLMMAFTRDGQLYDHLVQSVEKNYGVSFEKEREKRAYMEGLEHGVDPKANGGGTGLRLVLKEINLKPAVAAAT